MISTAVLSVRALGKKFGSFTALDGVSFALEKGQTIALLGPSGSGKTTALRCVAGLEAADAGSIEIAGRVVDDGRRRVAASRRRVGMVFQNYALWPHMTVARNVAFVAQRQGGLGRAEARARATDLLTSYQLGALLDRRPGEMSGGQQQRVAVARALAGDPSILLMDEPLSALDAQLRLDLRHEVRQSITRSGLACVYVTHDQDEALAVADMIGLMWQGRLVELGTPVDIYRTPATLIGARFFGARNTLQGTVGEVGAGGRAPRMTTGQAQVTVPFVAAPGWTPRSDEPVTVAFRPETARLTASERCLPTVRGRVTALAFLGTTWEYVVHVDGVGVDGGSECRVQDHAGIAGVGDTVTIHLEPDEAYGYPEPAPAVAPDTP